MIPGTAVFFFDQFQVLIFDTALVDYCIYMQIEDYSTTLCDYNNTQ